MLPGEDGKNRVSRRGARTMAVDTRGHALACNPLMRDAFATGHGRCLGARRRRGRRGIQLTVIVCELLHIIRAQCRGDGGHDAAMAIAACIGL